MPCISSMTLYLHLLKMIKILSKDLINKIAAGEVVERPASVVKELFENAIDAGATNIMVKIKGGGLEEISVSDNGSGILPGDAKMLFTEHATSKISSSDDLEKIGTFGFRGEALASIAAVSRISLITKVKSETEGLHINIQDGISSEKPAAANVGTVLSVSDLFFNVPARRKFMKSERTENAHVIKQFLETALANSHIACNLTIDGKEYAKYPISTIEERVRAICKVPLEPMKTIYDGEDCKITGMLVAPGTMTGTAWQYISVNGRPVNPGFIAKAVKEAYKSYILKNLAPSFVLFLEIDPLLVDVNVHPRKVEVRFLNQSKVYSAVYKGVQAYIGSMPDIETAIYANHPIEEKPSVLHDASDVYTTQIVQKSQYTVGSNRNKEWQPTAVGKFMHMGSDAALSFSQALLDTTPVEDSFAYLHVLQVDMKFIVYEKDGMLCIVDQHAASERINYEKYVKEYKEKKFAYKIALFPMHIELSSLQYVFALEHIDLIANFGIEFEDMGNNTIAIVKYSTYIPDLRLVDVCFGLIQELEEEHISDDATLPYAEKIIASLACRSAVMFGQKLTDIEMRELLKSLSLCDTPYTCAHGRPVQYTISFTDILKKLARC